ncbi:MAG: hypothetical protein WCG34_03560 [Leptolinea sp.]
MSIVLLISFKLPSQPQTPLQQKKLLDGKAPFNLGKVHPVQVGAKDTLR